TSKVETTLTASYTVKRETATVAEGTITQDGNGNISLTVPDTVKDGDVLAITYKATDIFGQSTSDVHTYTIDNTAPVLASSHYSDDSLKPTVNAKDPASSWYKDESLPFDIKYYDGGCGVERVEYTFTPSGGTAVTRSGIPTKVKANGKEYYQYTAAISDFAVGTNTLEFTAVDAAGNKSSSTTLNVKCDNVAPTLELVSIDGTPYDGSDGSRKLVNGTKDVTFIVKAADVTSGIKSVTVKKGNEVLTPNTDYTETLSGDVYTFKFKKDVLTTRTYAFTFTAEDNAGNTSEASANVSVDKTAPVITVKGVSPVVAAAGGNKVVNGKITVTGTVTDETKLGTTGAVTLNIKKTDGTSAKTAKTDLSDETYGEWSFVIDTTTLADNSTYTLEVTAVDAVGNTFTDSTTEINVDQSTDRPVVAITNASTDVKADEIASGKNLFNSTTNSTLNITVTDDDGISAPVIVNAWALKADGTKDTTSSVTTQKYEASDFTVGTTSANLTFNLPKTEGKYAVEVTARDTLYETATEVNKVNHENTSGITYYVAVDNGAPSLSIESKSGAYQVQDADFTVTGKVSDTSGARLFVSSKNINSIPAPSDTESKEIKPNTDTSFTAKVNAGTTSGTKYFVAFDAYGQRSSTEFKWKVDGKAPTMAPDFTFKPENWYKSRAVGISLPLADGWDKDNEKVIDDPSNISSVIATITAADGTVKATPLTLGGAYSADNYENQYYYYNTTLNFDADAKYNVSVTATDNAGNKGVFGPYKYNIDTTAPTVTVGDYVANLTGKEMNDENFAYKIPVTVSDTLSGIKPVTVKKGNEVLTKGTDYTETVSGDVYTFEFKKDVLTTGTYAFTFTAEDNAGNTSEASANVSVDKTAPVITVKGVSPVVAAAGGNKVVNGKITVTGTVTDETKLGTTGAVTLNIKKTDGTSAKTAKTDLSGGTYGEWSFEIDTTTLADNSTYTLEVTAVDAVGNTETNSKTKINVDQSTDTPSITPSNYDATVSTADSVEVIGDVIKNLFGTVSNNKLSG
ncbi:Ig-like domain-containing protein, partial [Treponema sp.]|uniref:Ig-like domain-containing protein n=1 Tax=Treponema sp. TaxID=166 RepID=UPI003FD7878B